VFFYSQNKLGVNLEIFNSLKRLYDCLDPERRSQLGLLTLLMVACALFEVVSIGALLPFLSVLSDPKKVYESQLFRPIISILGIDLPSEMLLPFTMIFCLATIFSAVLRLLLLYINSRLIYAVGGDLSVSIYKKTLLQPYSVHISRNSSQILDGITNKTTSLTECIRCAIALISSSILLLIIVSTLFIFQPIVTTEAILGFGLIYFSIHKLTTRPLSENGAKIARFSRSSIQSLQESLGGIRDILLDRTQQFYVNSYKNMVQPWRKAQGTNQFISGSPKFAIEALGIILFAFIAYELSRRSQGIAAAIPILGVLALSAQRLLPVLQQMFGSWSDLVTHRSSLAEALVLLEQPTPPFHVKKNGEDALPFSTSIKLQNVSFQYHKESQLVLKNINLEIPKGARVGLIGTTGSGKSTLLDLIMGLLHPTSGDLMIDCVTVQDDNLGLWQSKIAHVPQSIYLTDATVAENIAFGVDKKNINFEKVIKAAVSAQISSAIELMPKKYDSIVGERGINLSGGQRQRIGIARALYKGAEVIILDEATSALDSKTEDDVMSSIKNLSPNLTVVIVAHRHSTLQCCSDIYELESGSIVKHYTPQELGVHVK
jgi:ATP-binding cassette, subfamily B, bacterial PglK